jgi:hypothetical protein
LSKAATFIEAVGVGNGSTPQDYDESNCARIARRGPEGKEDVKEWKLPDEFPTLASSNFAEQLQRLRISHAAEPPIKCRTEQRMRIG